MSVWQPIETAPEKGKFLAWWRSKNMASPIILRWSEDGDYLWTDGGTAVHELAVSFSHWMPLPESPHA